MTEEERKKHVQMMNDYTVQIKDGRTRTEIFNELLEKGYERQEAVTICNICERDAERREKVVASKNRLLINGSVFTVLGTILFFSSGSIFELMLNHGFISARLVVVGLFFRFGGLSMMILGPLGILFHFIRKSREEGKQDVLD